VVLLPASRGTARGDIAGPLRGFRQLDGCRSVPQRLTKEIRRCDR